MYKSKLQELCHKKEWDLPVYATARDGPDHCPSFTATVTVQGQIFQSPANVCKSSKQAQNLAAKIAFDHLDSVNSLAISAAIQPPSPTALPSPGFLDAGNNKKLKENQVENSQTSLADQSLASCKDDIAPKDLHVYKNRLQHYAQKKNLNLPEYSCEIDGPPHARRFRASVKIGGRTFKSPVYFSTLKDSEHAAAKEALESLSVGEVQEDEGLYKTLLQELAQKRGLRFPSYTTITIGQPHVATFVSTVEIGGDSFEGRECKTKKLSEMNAAKNAYNSLVKRGDNKEGNTEFRGVSSKPSTSHGNRGANDATETHAELAAIRIGGDNKKGNTEVRGGSSKPSISHGNRGANDATETHAELAAIGIGEIHSDYSVLSPCDLQLDNENDAKAQDDPFSYSTSSECSKHGMEESDAEKLAGAGSTIVVRSRKSPMKIPLDATELPCSDDDWMAWEVKSCRRR